MAPPQTNPWHGVQPQLVHRQAPASPPIEVVCPRRSYIRIETIQRYDASGPSEFADRVGLGGRTSDGTYARTAGGPGYLPTSMNPSGHDCPRSGPNLAMYTAATSGDRAVGAPCSSHEYRFYPSRLSTPLPLSSPSCSLSHVLQINRGRCR
jgi:hypothetical protein